VGHWGRLEAPCWPRREQEIGRLQAINQQLLHNMQKVRASACCLHQAHSTAAPHSPPTAMRTRSPASVS